MAYVVAHAKGADLAAANADLQGAGHHCARAFWAHLQQTSVNDVELLTTVTCQSSSYASRIWRRRAITTRLG